jgi:hypothetical protein
MKNESPEIKEQVLVFSVGVLLLALLAAMKIPVF